MKQLAVVLGCIALAVPAIARAMPNPASAFCIHSGGRLVDATLPDGGTIGLCYLPDRRIIEEWTLFRMSRPGTPSPFDPGRSPR